MKISIVIPVFNGERYLAEILGAVQSQRFDGELEPLVIDSGSSDGSVAIARNAGVRVIKIPNAQFGHGRTRNLGAAETSGDLIAFLTQDATPAHDGWLSAYAAMFAVTEHLGAAFGPHLPRPGARPMMARMLLEFFTAFSPSGEPVVHRAGDIPYLSNSNSCIARAAWEEIGFREIEYAEDQAFGADLLAAGWNKAFIPEAGVLHSHDYGLIKSWRRYFDEYRGLHDSVGEKTAASPGRALAVISRSISSDRAYLTQTEQSRPRRLALTAYSVIYHFGRVVFGGLGARADRIPRPLRGLISLEGKDHAARGTHGRDAGER